MIAALADAVLWPLLALLGTIVAAVVAWAVGKREGRRDADTQHQIDSYNEYVATRKRIDEAFTGGDADAIRDSLRNRDPNKR
jgi:hypothetical protein